MTDSRSLLTLFLRLTFLLLLLSTDSLYAQITLVPCPKVIIDSVAFSGNKLTKDDIIRRELIFRAGDTVTSAELDQLIQRSRQNLLNTSLFNFVTVFLKNPRDLNADFVLDTLEATIGYCHCVIKMDFRERWYLWPQPILELFEQNINTWAKNPTLNRLSYGLYLSRYNFLGKKQVLTLTCKLGYAEQYGVSYTIPYIDRWKKSGLIFSCYFTQTHEVPYSSFNNQFLFYKDDGSPVRKEVSARITYTYRIGIYNTIAGECRYNHAWINDTIMRLSDNYFTDNQTTIEYFSLVLGFISDHRDNKPFPLKGYYINLSANKAGLGILGDEHTDLLQFGASLRGYWQIAGRLYAGVGYKGRLYAEKNVPFYLQNTLGYRDYVRGYEYYIVEGQNYSLLKNELRYQLISPHVKKIAFLPLEKFNTFHYALYAGIFADLAYVQSKDIQSMTKNTLNNTLMYGYGLGIDFVTYYDIVLRVEYAFNRMGENGLFLHLNSPL